MGIKLASELNLLDAPRCPAPACGAGILPYGRAEPFAVDEEGRPYCRRHGAIADPTYVEVHGAYKTRVREARLAALQALDEATSDSSAAE